MFKWLFDGFNSIAEGFSSFNLSPIDDELDFHKIHIQTDNEAFREDANAIAGDWETVGQSLRDVMSTTEKDKDDKHEN